MITRTFGRKAQHRKMMFRNLTTSVILYERVTTTHAKSKELKKIIDKVINTAKKENSLSARRTLLAYLLDKNATNKIFDVLVKRFNDRNSGYSRTLILTPRLGDGAQKVIIELIPEKKTTKKEEEITQKTENKIETKKLAKKE